MNVISQLLYDIWEGLKTLTVPIIDISFVDFLIGVFVVKLMISVFNYLLSKGYANNNDKNENG